MLRHQSPEAAMQPRSRSQDLRVFAFSLEYLNKLTGCAFFPLKKKALVKSLGFVGVPKARSGFTVRCGYPHEPQILHHIAQTVKLDKTIWTINAIPDCEGAPDPLYGPHVDDGPGSSTSRFCRFQYRRKKQVRQAG
eukprot:Skav226441  [mRNA]  locus=scaffold2660:148760:149167:+ [translate_table: standard]